jgi:hypothetical protein
MNLMLANKVPSDPGAGTPIRTNPRPGQKTPVPPSAPAEPTPPKKGRRYS